MESEPGQPPRGRLPAVFVLLASQDVEDYIANEVFVITGGMPMPS